MPKDTKPIIKTVEEWLDTADYSNDERYVPSKFALEFVSFIKLVNGGSEENITPVLHYKMLDTIANPKNDHILNMVFRGAAKMQPASSKVLTKTGWTTMGDLQQGDKVVTHKGREAIVLVKTEPKYDDVYLMTLSDGSQTRVGIDHNHLVVNSRGNTSVVTTKEMLDIGLKYECSNKPRKDTRQPKASYRYAIPVTNEIGGNNLNNNCMPPYSFGYSIANGYYNKGVISSHIDDIEEIMEHFSFEKIKCTRHSDNGINAGRFDIGNHWFKEYANLTSQDKYIPNEYKYASVEQRWELLRGLMDGDGNIGKNGSCSYSTVSEKLANDVYELVKSLGGFAKVSYGNRGYVVRINTHKCPFKLTRKATRWKPTKKKTLKVVSLEKIECNETSYCIYLDKEEHTYITDNYIVTHNTTLFAEYFILYLATFGGMLPGRDKQAVGIYVGDSMESGVKSLRKNLEYRWGNSDFLQTYVPNARFTDDRWWFENKAKDITIFKGFGAKSGVRGFKEMGQRPTIAILDDLISDEDAKSETIRANVEDVVHKAVDHALHPTNKIKIWSGTPFNANDPLYKAVESGAWTVNVFPVCEHFPCDKKDFKGAWTDRFTYEAVKKNYDKAVLQGKVSAFNQELMLRIMSDEDRLILPQDIKWFNTKDVMKFASNFNFYITTDFATTEKTSGDYSFISVWAYNNNGDWYWIDGICERQTMEKSIDALFGLCSQYQPQTVGIEVTGQQQGFVSWIQQEMISRNIFFNMASNENSNRPGIRPNTNKLQRFNVVVPLFKAGKMYFPSDKRTDLPMIEMMNELGLASMNGFKSKHDDAIDTISMLASLKAWRPSEPMKMVKKDNDIYAPDYVDDLDDDYIDSYIV